MTITYIDSGESTPNERVAFITHPPLTEEVFAKFRALGFATHFVQENELLIVRKSGFSALDANFKKATELRLTESEQAIEREKEEANAAHKIFINGLFRDTGIPVYTKPA